MMIGVKQPLSGVVYPEKERLERYVREGALSERTLADCLMESFKNNEEKIAISWPDGTYTYAELDKLSTKFAAALLSSGLAPLDRVIFQVPNSPQIVIALIACWKANLIPVCTLAAHRELEITQLANQSQARAHFIFNDEKFDFEGFSSDIRSQCPSIEQTIVLKGTEVDDWLHMENMISATDLSDAVKDIERVERDPYQVVAFQLSGGTTSVPKIIPRFSNEYLYNMQAMADWENFTSDDVVFMPLQIIHNASMACFMFPTLLRGGEVVVATNNEPATIFTLLATRKPTFFGVVGTALNALAKAGAREILDLSRVRGVFSMNAARQTEEILGVKGLHIFGMTEGLIIFARPEDSFDARLRTVGRPISRWDEVRIVQPGTVEDLPIGEVGEMITRGPYTIAGYLNAPERNKQAFTADGFYRSGDLMMAHEFDGKLYYSFEGRIKDLVSRGGEKINCEEVEHASRRHKDIADIAIVAMPDPIYEERACAFIIPKPGHMAPNVDELAEFLVTAGMAKFKCPERIEAIDAFPLTDSGKLSKPKLKELIEQKLVQEAGKNNLREENAL